VYTELQGHLQDDGDGPEARRMQNEIDMMEFLLEYTPVLKPTIHLLMPVPYTLLQLQLCLVSCEIIGHFRIAWSDALVAVVSFKTLSISRL